MGSLLNEGVRIYIYFAVSFLIPFTIGHPQILVGTIVNAVLITAALESRGFGEMLPLLFAPSIAVLARGILFGPMTPYIVIMIPFIWAGNAILVLGVKKCIGRCNVQNFFIVSSAIISKVAIISAGAVGLVLLSLAPDAIVGPMGIMQAATAIAGGLAAFSARRLHRLLQNS